MISVKVMKRTASSSSKWWGWSARPTSRRRRDAAARVSGVGVHLRGEGAPFSILADWERLDGWEKGAKTFGTVLNKAIGDGAKKLAVVADERFLDEQPRLADALSNATVRFFPSGDTEQALAWLRDR